MKKVIKLELERLQMIAEVVLEFRTQLKNDLEVEAVGEILYNIVKEYHDAKLYELISQAFELKNNPPAAIQYVNKALAYLHEKIELKMS